MEQTGGKQNKRAKTFSAQDVSLFCEQVSLTLRAGIPLADGVESIAGSVEEQQGRAVLLQVASLLRDNRPFYEALEQAQAFPSYLVRMVEIGEKAGKLDAVVDSLALHYERESKLKKSVRSAVVSPFVLVLMMAAVLAVLVAKVLPIFRQVFEDLGAQMSGASSFFLDLGVTIGQYAFVVLLLVALLLLAAVLVSKTKGGGRWLRRFLSRFFATRKLFAKLASARFASVMAMLLSSGYDTDEALRLVPGVLQNDLVAAKVEQVRTLVAEGTSFAGALEQVKLFPGIYGKMVSIGAKSGSLDTVMQKLAELYSDEVDTAIANAVAVIEPVLVGVLSVVIGAILLAVMLPLMSIMSSIG